MRRIFAAMLALFLGVSSAHAQLKDSVTLEVVKYEALGKEVLKHRGKVVMIDIWGVNCVPCIAKFPHVVELQRKYAKDGLVILTVTLDAVEDQEDALKRLIQKKVPLTNFLLEDAATAQQKLRVEGVPAVYLFDRQGRWTLFPSAQVDKADEKLVELLQEKNGPR
ncbi:MAG: TlpA family protein disulfide reductase [Gemmataceae bacterium]|nr:TlpA family protein disulfide reductase [Gemmataceae bacterium]